MIKIEMPKGSDSIHTLIGYNIRVPKDISDFSIETENGIEYLHYKSEGKWYGINLPVFGSWEIIELIPNKEYSTLRVEINE